MNTNVILNTAQYVVLCVVMGLCMSIYLNTKPIKCNNLRKPTIIDTTNTATEMTGVKIFNNKISPLKPNDDKRMRVVIKQEVERYSFTDDTYLLSTEVWVKDSRGYAVTLEMWETDKGKLSDFEKLKPKRLAEAERIKRSLEKKLNK